MGVLVSLLPDNNGPTSDPIIIPTVSNLQVQETLSLKNIYSGCTSISLT